MDQPQLTFEIPEWRWESVKKKLNALVRRAGKKGLTHFAYEVSPDKVIKTFSRQVPVTLDDMPCDNPYKWEAYDLECVVVTINCPKPSLNGWSFVGRIEHMREETEDTSQLGDTINLVYAAPDEEVPAEYHKRDQVCEHCNYNRLRRDTFIIRKGDEYKQVGSTCLGDFLGVDASSMLAYAEIIEGAITLCGDPDDFDDAEWGMMRQSRCYGLREVLRAAAALTLNAGYISRKAADESFTKTPTSEILRSYLSCKCPKTRDEIIPSKWWGERVNTLVDETLTWLQDLATQEFDELGDYLRNLVAVVKINRCPWKAIGILGSAPYSLMRKQERDQQNADAQKSTHQGTIKQRIERTVTVVMEKPYSSMYGEGVIYKFVDADGNRYLWFASTNKGWSVGTELTIKGTVKGHEQDKYEGDCNVTVINRVSEVK